MVLYKGVEIDWYPTNYEVVEKKELPIPPDLSLTKSKTRKLTLMEEKQVTNEKVYKSPSLTVDAIITTLNGIVLIERDNEPYGWALPGGFVDYNESVEDAVVREVFEETGLDFQIWRQFHTYSAPDRDPRKHVVSVVFIGRGIGDLRAGDDASGAGIFNQINLPSPLVFDHALILNDFFNNKY
jgi:8-oxo-dGTP diphosphatase